MQANVIPFLFRQEFFGGEARVRGLPGISGGGPQAVLSSGLEGLEGLEELEGRVKS